jgi:hypothetical protein
VLRKLSSVFSVLLPFYSVQTLTDHVLAELATIRSNRAIPRLPLIRNAHAVQNAPTTPTDSVLREISSTQKQLNYLAWLTHNSRAHA